VNMLLGVIDAENSKLLKLYNRMGWQVWRNQVEDKGLIKTLIYKTIS